MQKIVRSCDKFIDLHYKKELQLGRPLRLPHIKRIQFHHPDDCLSDRAPQNKSGNPDTQKANEHNVSQINLTVLFEGKGESGQTERDRSKEKKNGLPRIFREKKRMNQLNNEQRELIVDRVCRIKSQRNFLLSQQHMSNFEQKYERGKHLGQGSNAKVISVRHLTTGEEFAAKIYEREGLREEDRRLNLYRQIKILKKCNHPNILRLHQTISCQSSVFIVTEVFSNKSLATYLKSRKSRLSELEAAQIFVQLAKAVDYLHANRIVHRDIKLQNVLIDRNKQIKLIDFGFAIQVDTTDKLKNFCGTPKYMSPQMVLKKGYLGKPVDVWAMGVLLYNLVTGSMPFKAPDQKTLFTKIIGFQYQQPQRVSKSLGKLLESILRKSAQQRISAGQILKNAWLAQSLR